MMQALTSTAQTMMNRGNWRPDQLHCGLPSRNATGNARIDGGNGRRREHLARAPTAAVEVRDESTLQLRPRCAYNSSRRVGDTRCWPDVRSSLQVGHQNELVGRVRSFGRHYDGIAKPFEWKFMRVDLPHLLKRIQSPGPLCCQLVT